MKKILIANRGEIAVRIIRTLREMGIVSIAVYSKADRSSLHCQLADEAYYLGESEAKNSYLNIEKILQIASRAGANAIHPGYGFLAEDSNFIKILEDVGIKFIGPHSSAVFSLGNKVNARNIANSLKIPILSSETKYVETHQEAIKVANNIGYPVILKAAQGGGGRGIRIIKKTEEIKDSFISATKEAENAFSNGQLYLEKYLEKVRHIEVQILADNFGNVVHLGERECSLQRKRQKMIEEAPALISENLRTKIIEDAMKLMKHVKYNGVGTVEFLVDEHENYFFMEVNTRIQVEHPVSEMITGIDLIREQIKVGLDEKLSFNQKDIKFKGHAIEARICADDPFNNFMPSVGKIEKLHFPSGFNVRVDTYLQNYQIISPFYDSMLAKLICHDNDRVSAIRKLRAALMETKIFGIKTTIPFLQSLIRDERFTEGKVHTTFVDEFLKNMVSQKEFFKENEEMLVAILAAFQQKKHIQRQKESEEMVKKESSRWSLEGRMIDMKGIP